MKESNENQKYKQRTWEKSAPSRRHSTTGYPGSVQNGSCPHREPDPVRWPQQHSSAFQHKEMLEQLACFQDMTCPRDTGEFGQG